MPKDAQDNAPQQANAQTHATVTGAAGEAKTLRLYNTLSRAKDDFRPIDPASVRNEEEGVGSGRGV